MAAWVDSLRLLTQPELMEGPAEGRSNTREIKDGHSSRPVGGAETGSQAERTHSEALAGRPREVADCGPGWAKLQPASKAAAGGPGDRSQKPRVPAPGNKASNH